MTEQRLQAKDWKIGTEGMGRADPEETIISHYYACIFAESNVGPWRDFNQGDKMMRSAF